MNGQSGMQRQFANPSRPSYNAPQRQMGYPGSNQSHMGMQQPMGGSMDQHSYPQRPIQGLPHDYDSARSDMRRPQQPMRSIPQHQMPYQQQMPQPAMPHQHPMMYPNGPGHMGTEVPPMMDMQAPFMTEDGRREYYSRCKYSQQFSA